MKKYKSKNPMQYVIDKNTNKINNILRKIKKQEKQTKLIADTVQLQYDKLEHSEAVYKTMVQERDLLHKIDYLECYEARVGKQLTFENDKLTQIFETNNNQNIFQKRAERKFIKKVYKHRKRIIQNLKHFNLNK